MKVLQVIDKLNVGGAERVCVDLTNLMFEKNINVSILTFDSKGKLQEDLHQQIFKINLNRKNKYNILKAYRLSKIIKQYDIVHVHMRHVYRYVKLVSLLFFVKTPVILHDHTSFISEENKIPFLFNSLLKPDYYIGVSIDLVNWAERFLKIEKGNVFLLRNIVRRDSIHTGLVKKNGIVLVGNIRRVKNQLFAIQIAHELGKDLTLIGVVQDHDYNNELIREIKRLNYQNKIHFLHNVSNVQKLLPQFELGIMTSFSESGPLVLVEFLAQSLPFVAFNTGEISKVLKTNLQGYFLDSFDKKSWLDTIKKVSLEPNKDLITIFNTHFSSEDYITRCLKIYKKIINS